MIGALGLALLIHAPEPEPIAFLFLTPSGELTHVRSSEVLSFLDQRFDRDTDLELEPMDAGRAGECRGRMSCLVELARPDYQRRDYLLANDTLAPFEEHLAYLEQRQIRPPRLLIILSGVGTAQVDALTGSIIDTDRALAYRHPRDTLSRRDQRTLEREATIGTPFRAEVSSPQEVRPTLQRFFEQALRPELERRGHWRPFGSVVLQTPVEGAAVIVDGELKATTRGPETTVSRLRPGVSTLRLEHPDYRPFETTVTVVRQQSIAVDADLRPTASNPDLARQLSLWSGVAVAAAGAGFIVAGAVDASQNELTVACEGCGGFRFRSFSTRADEDPLAPLDESGPLIVPLGYSLMLTGTTWAVGSALTERERIPWWPLVLGLAGGGLAYGLSAALNGSP
jgi:hypothetical protein